MKLILNPKLNEILTSLFNDKWFTLLLGLLLLFVSITDIKKNYNKVGPAGKSSKIGLFALGLIFIIISIVTFFK
jgi:hypothetical protein